MFWGFWAQNTIKMKREVRRIHWYTAEKEKTNDRYQSYQQYNFAWLSKY